jgi:hypothetical protein
MERELPLMENGVLRGHILCREEGCYMTFVIDVPLWGSGMKKVWLVSEQGGRLLLGTLVPERSRLRLRRRLSHSALRCCGVPTPVMGQINPQSETADGWNPIKSLKTRDSVLASGLAEIGQGHWRRRENCLELRFPWCVGQKVPLTSHFCLGEPKEGWWYVKIRE